jgi:hypothetical protein
MSSDRRGRTIASKVASLVAGGTPSGGSAVLVKL